MPETIEHEADDHDTIEAHEADTEFTFPFIDNQILADTLVNLQVIIKESPDGRDIVSMHEYALGLMGIPSPFDEDILKLVMDSLSFQRSVAANMFMLTLQMNSDHLIRFSAAVEEFVALTIDDDDDDDRDSDDGDEDYDEDEESEDEESNDDDSDDDEEAEEDLEDDEDDLMHKE